MNLKLESRRKPACHGFRATYDFGGRTAPLTVSWKAV